MRRIEEATDFLRTTLASGPHSAGEVVARAIAVGIAPRTLRRAKKMMGVTSMWTLAEKVDQTEEQEMIKVTELNFGGYPIRLYQDAEGNHWWVGKDVCDALGLLNVRSAVSDLAENERVLINVQTPGGPQRMNAVNESGLYRLIFKSRKLVAAQFQFWAVQVAMPAIRGVHARPESNHECALEDALKERQIAEHNLVKKQVALEHCLEQFGRVGTAAPITANCGYYTVRGWYRRYGLDITIDEAARHGRCLTALCALRGVQPGQIKDFRFGRVNTYPETILNEYFGELQS